MTSSKTDITQQNLAASLAVTAPRAPISCLLGCFPHSWSWLLPTPHPTPPPEHHQVKSLFRLSLVP